MFVVIEIEVSNNLNSTTKHCRKFSDGNRMALIYESISYVSVYNNKKRYV